MLAMVAMVNPGRGLILRLEEEEFTVDNRQLSRLLSRDDALYAHVIPAGRRGWLVAVADAHHAEYAGYVEEISAQPDRLGKIAAAKDQ